jgi:hypothetical protein
MNRVPLLILCAALAGSACDQLSPSKAAAFDRIAVGRSSRPEVLDIMGTASNRTLHNFAGLEVEHLTFEDSLYRYEVRIAATPFSDAVVVSKTLLPKKAAAR